MIPHSENESHRSLAHRLMGLTASDLTLEPLLLELFAKKPRLVQATQQLLHEIETARAEKAQAHIPAPTAEKAPIYLVLDNDGTLMDDVYNAYLKSRGFCPKRDGVEKFKAKDRAGYAMGHSALSTMVEISNSLPHGKRLTKFEMKEFSAKMPCYPGADTFVSGLKEAFADTHPNHRIETAILSTGIRELVAYTSVAKTMDQIWSSKMKYNEHGELCGIKGDIDPVAKVSFLLMIQKGITAKEYNEKFADNDPRGPSAIRAALNKYVPVEELKRSLRRTLYIGDGDTDYHVFDAVRLGGGAAILVYDPKNEEKKEKAENLLAAGRVDGIAEPDYSLGSALSDLILKQTQKLIELDAIFHFYEMKAKLVDLADTAALPKISQKQAKGLGAKFERFAESKVPHKKLLPAHRVR